MNIRNITISIISIIATLIVFVFLIATMNSFYVQTTIIVIPNNDVTASQADHVVNNIAEIPERDQFSEKLIKKLSDVTTDQWNQHIRTYRQPNTGYIAMNIRGASFEQAQALSIAATELWIMQIKEFYAITKDVDVKIVEQDFTRGSWREFSLAIIFSLLIGLLISLFIQLLFNTFSMHKKKKSQAPPAADVITPPIQSQSQRSDEQVIATPTNIPAKDSQDELSHLSYTTPTFNDRSQVIKATDPTHYEEEEFTRIRLQHARAQERNLMAATAKEHSPNEDQVQDLFETFAAHNQPHGAEGIGKSEHIDAAPENLPIADKSFSFDISVEEHTQPKNNTPKHHDKEKATQKSEPKSTSTEHDTVEISTPDDQPRQTVSTITFGASQELPESSEEKKSSTDTTTRGTVSGAPMNLPIAGVTGKTTAAKLQEDIKTLTFTQPEETKEKQQEPPKEKKKTIDRDREPTDEELKDRLNQLLKGNFKTK